MSAAPGLVSAADGNAASMISANSSYTVSARGISAAHLLQAAHSHPRLDSQPQSTEWASQDYVPERPLAPLAASVPDAAPTTLFYNYPSCSGSQPAARWAHAACVVGGSVLVHGGIGHAMFDDLWALDVGDMRWRALSPTSSSSKDKPEKVIAHASAAVGNTMWVFGGQQGRSILRKLYRLDLDVMVWKRVYHGTLPSPRAGHSMIAVGNTIFLFGGQGKRLLNDLHRLDVATGLFQEIPAAGRVPSPRRGVGFCHDGKDLLVCFGGSVSSSSSHSGSRSVDNALHVFSLQSSEWYCPQQLGEVPCARANHSAVQLAPNQVLIFGGCNAQGAFLNDAYVLDTLTFTWTKPHVLNAAPAPRYHHSCCMVNGRMLMFGGINAKQIFDGVVMLETQVANEMSHIVEELQSLVASSSSNTVEARDSPVIRDMMKVQLTDLLYKRNMEELRAQASHKAETTELLLAKERESLEGLRRENLQLKMLNAEAEQAAAAAREQARAAETRAARSVQALAELRAAHDAVLGRLGEREVEAANAKRLHQELVKELGTIASRYAKLQRKLNQASGSGKQRNRPHKAGDEDLCVSSSQYPAHQALAERGSLPSTRSAPLAFTPELELHANGGHQRDANRSSNVVGPFDEMLTVLVDLEEQRDALQQRADALQGRLDGVLAEQSLLQGQVRQLSASREDMAALSLGELQQLEQRLDGALRAAREEALQRRIVEVEQRALREQQCCSLCLERPRCIVFTCGHQSCGGCSEKLQDCPFCRAPITAKIKMFNS